MEKKDICELNIDEMKALMKEYKEPAFRAVQIYGWLHKNKAVSFDEMNNIPKTLKEKLSADHFITIMNAGCAHLKA